MSLSWTADQDPPSEENKAQFVKYQRVLPTEALSPKLVMNSQRQGSIVHHLTKAAHRREMTALQVMIGWSQPKMVLTTAMTLVGMLEALQGTEKIGTMIALKLMAAAAAAALGMTTGAPLRMMMTTTTATHQEGASRLKTVFL